MKGIKVQIKDDTIFSMDHPDRAIREVPFGWALYLKAENGFGVHVGLADDKGAFDWLNGVPIEEINYHRVYNPKPDPYIDTAT